VTDHVGASKDGVQLHQDAYPLEGRLGGGHGILGPEPIDHQQAGAAANGFGDVVCIRGGGTHQPEPGARPGLPGDADGFFVLGDDHALGG
jgi:hypothetical protein